MPQEGERIGSYEITGKLGEGGMGEVYLARDTRLGRVVALKMLPPTFAQDSERLGRFRREALALAALNHPNVATIYGFEEPGDGSLALVLERVQGETLAERLEREPPSIEEGLQICAQIAEALEVAHEQGIVHRDLKPGNVMIGARGLVKVLDFGLARAADEEAETETSQEASRTEAAAAEQAQREAAAAASGPASTADGLPKTEFGAIVGTPGYMSPEQAMGIEHDERADVFSFGCVLYECLTGQRAFPGEDFEALGALMHGAADMDRLPERTPPRVRKLLDRCLEKDFEARLQKIREARIEIEDVLGVRRAAALRAGEAVATPNNLPKQATSFVGRETMLSECRELLAQTRILTLTGVGGGGKTRLAVRLAEESLETHPDGVWFANLAPVSDGTRVLETVAMAMGVREETGRPLVETLQAHIGAARVLVLLDNCEHLLEACAEVVTSLLGACQEMAFLLTSREPLNVEGELVHVVPSLSTPQGRALTAAAAGESEAVQLFVERARVARRGFALTDADAPAVVEICQRVDGIPLALELAAARVRMLGVAEIRDKLDDRFRLLTGGSRTSLPRQQTLLATIQWSYDQLLPEEQDMFESLAVFGGGWTLGSATAICMESGDEFEVLDLLTRLSDKSLVVTSRLDGGTSRYRFLETVRDYASRVLEEAKEKSSAVRTRHMNYFLALSESAEKELTGPDQGRWFSELESERENLIAALGWCRSLEGGGEPALRLASAVARFWTTRGYIEIGRRMLNDALSIAEKAPSEPRAKALVRAGSLALYQGDHAAARPLVEESLAIHRDLGDTRGVARALSGLAVIAAYQEDFETAKSIAQEGMQLYRELGQTRGVGVSMHNLGWVLRCTDDLEEAKKTFEGAVELFREVGDKEYIALALVDLVITLLRQGDTEAARHHLLEAIPLAIELQAKREGALALDAAAELALALGDAGRAARLVGAAGNVRSATGSKLIGPEQKERDSLEARVREAVGTQGDGARSPDGGGFGFDAALEETRAWLDGLQTSGA